MRPSNAKYADKEVGQPSTRHGGRRRVTQLRFFRENNEHPAFVYL